MMIQRSPRKSFMRSQLSSMKNQLSKNLIFPLLIRHNQLKKLMIPYSNHSLLVRLRRSTLPQIISLQLKRTPLREDMLLCFLLQPPSKSLFTPFMKTLSTLNLSMITQNPSSSLLRMQVLELKKSLPLIQL